MDDEARVAVVAWAAAILLSGVVVGGCGAPGDNAAAPRGVSSTAPESRGGGRGADSTLPPSPLAGTEWRLVEIQSMDDAVGTSRPEDPSRYTMRLNDDGTVALRLNCNSARGTWSVEAGPDRLSGRFEFGPLAATRALCAPPSLDERIGKEAQFVRSYLMKDGRLYLSLLADGGIQVWEPHAEETFQTQPDPNLEAAILRESPSYTRAVVDVEGSTGRGRYVYGRIDLNGDGRDEVFVYLLGSSFCGTAGWSDLLRLESGGGVEASYVRHVFDGKRYVERERLPAAKTPEGKSYLAGELTFEIGIPLAPRK